MIREGKKSFTDYFRKPPDPKELVRKWQSDLRTQQRAIEKQLREIAREEQKAVKQCKEAAKRNDLASAKVIAKELVHTRKAISHLHVNKAHMIAMNAQLTEQLGVVKVAGTLSKSTQVMKMVNELIKVPQLNAVMRDMSREMMKAGMIDEIIDDTLDSAMDSEDMEEETEAEINKVLTEVAGETLAQLSAAPKTRVNQQQQLPQQQEEEGEEEEDDLAERLNAIRSQA